LCSAAAALQLSYAVPAVADRAAPPGIAGVYLTVRVGDRESRRRLGGVRVSAQGIPADTADAAAIAEAMAAIDRIHTIGFEPASSTTAHLLDDVIGVVLTAELVEDAWAAGPAAIVAAGADWRRVPATLAWLADAVPSGSGATAVPDGLRVTVLTDRVGPDGLVQLSDVVPALNRAVGTGSDPAAAFRAALRATIGASIRESEVFGTSAAGQLGSDDFVVVPASSSVDVVTAWSPEQRARLAPMVDEYADFHRLLPASGEIAAMWVVDPDTGSATAVGADGRGGGTALPDCLTPADTNEATAFITVSIALDLRGLPRHRGRRPQLWLRRRGRVRCGHGRLGRLHGAAGYPGFRVRRVLLWRRAGGGQCRIGRRADHHRRPPAHRRAARRGQVLSSRAAIRPSTRSSESSQHLVAPRQRTHGDLVGVAPPLIQEPAGAHEPVTAPVRGVFPADGSDQRPTSAGPVPVVRFPEPLGDHHAAREARQ
jgi:hypothetical protein